MSEKIFAKEDRYLVFKYTDIDFALTTHEKETLHFLANKVFLNRQERGKIPLECVVVESDWPNYNEVWKSVEKVAVGTFQSVDEAIDELLSTYGDNWYDGFIAAKEINKTIDLESYDDQSIIALSEQAEKLWIKSKSIFKYYCQCDNPDCGNWFEVSEIGATCKECGQGKMQPQDVEPY
ncbi:hypothetical protein D6U64_15090 [Vibrio cholerae]|nr:hypothetical protein [Vibrio cholerae]MVE66383.1 hypothetical protein [Vibrio cholerae]MVF00880.1 hypothetical protein [Vibrio cholerae]MVF87031.1 hypothetical protein [Vibrio cholerae]